MLSAAFTLLAAAHPGLCATAIPACNLSRWPVIRASQAGEAAGAPQPASARVSIAGVTLLTDCSADEDGNGLDDEVESELARCVAPQFRFDGAENALRGDEPHVLFSAALIAPDKIRIHYAVLFADDGGYVLGTTFPCQPDAHHGDSEGLVVDVRIAPADKGALAVPAALRTSGPPGTRESSTFDDRSGAILFGTHPVVYATAGKHHWLQHTADLSYACQCGPLGPCGSVRDRADGRGRWVVPARVDQAPFFFRDAGSRRTLGRDWVFSGGAGLEKLPVVRSASALDSNRSRWWNACELEQNGRLVPALRALRSDDLSDLGYAGERIDSECFRGGFGGSCTETESVASVLAWDRPVGPRTTMRRILGYLLGTPDPRDSQPPSRVSELPR